MSDRPLRIGGYEAEPERLEWREFRKKPVVVEAAFMREPFEVETLEGTMKGNTGDVLIRGVEGELYPCSKSVFAQSYERVEDSGDEESVVRRYAGPAARGAVVGVVGGLSARALRRIRDA